MNYKVFLASDHSGVQYKSDLIAHWKQHFPNDEIVDIGPHQEMQSTDYSDWALTLCRDFITARASGNSYTLGVLICGSGIGMSMVANRFSGIRAALCRSEEDARLSREHNDANVLCLGARFTTIELAKQMVQTWRLTVFAEGRHRVRIDKFSSMGEH
ncbi:MAG: RpiB/LacA/LacB family sugar-phosphate isomerase [Oligoflexia bacterium]|nr:RpiB/LacA/LacB family sugar-phosphate isomerase [Oligoflexia bacterium]MBF0363984.1 RpiB/LacA/LacB family sugar-phosphate isomerase [Oligoflexia bacterium]